MSLLDFKSPNESRNLFESCTMLCTAYKTLEIEPQIPKHQHLFGISRPFINETKVCQPDIYHLESVLYCVDLPYPWPQKIKILRSSSKCKSDEDLLCKPPLFRRRKPPGKPSKGTKRPLYSPSTPASWSYAPLLVRRLET
jgi:hypothetical protein